MWRFLNPVDFIFYRIFYRIVFLFFFVEVLWTGQQFLSANLNQQHFSDVNGALMMDSTVNRRDISSATVRRCFFGMNFIRASQK